MSSTPEQEQPISAAPADAEIVIARPAGNRGWSVAAWIVVGLVTSLVIVAQMFASSQDEQAAPGPSELETSLLELQGKLLVGAKALLPESSDEEAKKAKASQAESFYRQTGDWKQGSLDQRLRLVVLAGELVGVRQAQKELKELRSELRKPKIQASSPPQTGADGAASKAAQNGAQSAGTNEDRVRAASRLAAILSRLYSDYARSAWQAPSLSDSDRQMLRTDLGWFGELALAPEQSPDKSARSAAVGQARLTMAVAMVAGGLLLAVASAGLIGLVLFVVLFTSGKIGPALATPSGNGGVYAETFAAWMVFHVGASIVSTILFAGEPPLWAAIASFLVGLSALAWPVLRGIPWSQVKRDIGWVRGRSGWLEPLWGVVGYICTMPLVFAGVLMYSALVKIADQFTDGKASQTPPTHPIVDWISDGAWGQIALIVLLASVCAPILEETFFRGVLYRHLRDATWKWRLGASILFSSLFNGVLFASLHPQGLLAVPMLAAIALGLSLQREWRGSLIAPMVAHGVNNGVATVILLAFTQ